MMTKRSSVVLSRSANMPKHWPKLADMANKARSWPYHEARRLAEKTRSQDRVVFETGYGPSGLPHLGTFSEVLRTSWVRQAFTDITEKPSVLIAFSDDMDGMRKIPGNIPNPDRLKDYIDKPLTYVPDPFGTHDSFAAHNNARLRNFLDSFNLDYTFYSSTECYQSGKFDNMLLKALEQYQAIMDIMLPTLGPERRKTYSPFLPICPDTRQVLQVPALEWNTAKGTLVYEHPATGKKTETLVTGGHCKLQWKADWAMRWAALEVDYEIYGKDITPSAEQASKIVRKLGAQPPAGFAYELFLDEQGAKISKSKGNGISMEEWLTYATEESLALFLYSKPRTAKRLFFDIIPKTVDETFRFRSQICRQTPEERLDNPAWFFDRKTDTNFRDQKPDDEPDTVDFTLLLNLATVCGARDSSELWQFLLRTKPGLKQSDHIKQLMSFAIRYSEDKVRPTLRREPPDQHASTALRNLAQQLKVLDKTASAEDIQTVVFDVGKGAGYNPLRLWFQTLYRCLLGQDSGPRLGSLFSLYGLPNSIRLIEETLAASTSGVDTDTKRD